MKVYADSSFFVSIYLPDVHTAAAVRKMARHPQIWLTPFHEAELANAIAQQLFRRTISPDYAHRTVHNIASNRKAWVCVGFPEGAFAGAVELARRLVPRVGARTLDSVHVACALELGAEQFWTFDRRQAKLAKAAGLKVL